jgi:hypothetical protein
MDFQINSEYQVKLYYLPFNIETIRIPKEHPKMKTPHYTSKMQSF